MASLAFAWSPNSSQLQLAFRYRKSHVALFLRSRIFSSRGRRLRVVRVVGNGTGETVEPAERRRTSDSWTSSGDSADTSSDWFASGRSDSSKSTEGIPDIVGAGLAGILLVAGLSFAAMAISKKTASKRVQEMEPLTKQQEVLLGSDDEVLSKRENLEDGEDIVNGERKMQNVNHLKAERGGEGSSPSFPESTTDSTENLPNNTGLATSSRHDEYASDDSPAPVRENLQSEGLGDPDINKTNILKYPESQNADNPSGVSSYVDSQSYVVVVASEELLDHTDLSNMSNSRPDDLQGPLESIGANDSLQEVELSSRTVSSEGQYSDDSTVYKYGGSEPEIVSEGAHDVAAPATSSSSEPKVLELSGSKNPSAMETDNSEWYSVNTESALDQSLAKNKLEAEDQIGVLSSESVSQSESPVFSNPSTGIPAPSALPATLLTPPGKVLVPAAVDQTQGQALAALQVLKVIEADAQPSDLCTRRDYARWLVTASSTLSRNSISKVYPAMYIENITELAFDDITPDDPDFPSIQGLAEAGLIASKLSAQDTLSHADADIGSFNFFADSPLSRQDLVTWKMALEKRQFPDTNRKILQEVSGFIDIDRIDSNAWPALVADISVGEHGIVALAFGYTRLFQPDKPVTKAQAATALATGEAADIVSEELARIEAESVAENAVAVHNALVAEVEKDINSNFEKELLLEREKVGVVEKLAEEARQELESLREEREKDNIALMKERTAIESEMEILSKLRREVEEQLEGMMGKKAEISYEKERIENLRKATEEENQAIARLQYELEVERRALSMARAWAEDEARRVRENAKALEEARDRWEKRGIKVVVDEDLQKEAAAEGATWIDVEKQLSVGGVVDRAETLLDKLKVMSSQVSRKSREVIDTIIQKITALISALKEWADKARKQTAGLKDASISKIGESVLELKQSTAGISVTIQEGAKRVAVDCRDGVGRLAQKFKT